MTREVVLSRLALALADAYADGAEGGDFPRTVAEARALVMPEVEALAEQALEEGWTRGWSARRERLMLLAGMVVLAPLAWAMLFGLAWLAIQAL